MNAVHGGAHHASARAAGHAHAIQPASETGKRRAELGNLPEEVIDKILMMLECPYERLRAARSLRECSKHLESSVNEYWVSTGKHICKALWPFFPFTIVDEQKFASELLASADYKKPELTSAIADAACGHPSGGCRPLVWPNGRSCGGSVSISDRLPHFYIYGGAVWRDVHETDYRGGELYPWRGRFRNRLHYFYKLVPTSLPGGYGYDALLFSLETGRSVRLGWEVANADASGATVHNEIIRIGRGFLEKDPELWARYIASRANHGEWEWQ